MTNLNLTFDDISNIKSVKFLSAESMDECLFLNIDEITNPLQVSIMLKDFNKWF